MMSEELEDVSEVTSGFVFLTHMRSHYFLPCARYTTVRSTATSECTGCVDSLILTGSQLSDATIKDAFVVVVACTRALWDWCLGETQLQLKLQLATHSKLGASGASHL